MPTQPVADMSEERCPLLFSFRDKAYGKGFVAEIAAHGRVLAVHEGDAYWMYGVLPGGLAAEGKDPTEAYMNFRRAFMEVLFDIAGDSDTFEQFRATAQRFFDTEDAVNAQTWREAVEKARAGHIKVEGIPTKRADEPRFIKIELKEHFTPKDNQLDPVAHYAVAKAA